MSARAMGGERTALAAAGLLLLQALLTVGAAMRLGETSDERVLWGAGGAAAVRGDWTAIDTTYQGPLGVLPNQLLAPVPADVQTRPTETVGPAFEGSELLRARLGMLPFALLAGWLVFWSARRLFGAAAGLLALACFVLHPLTSGYGALVAVDMAFSALVMLALAAALRHAERPTAARAAAVGAALGLALATKYLAALVVPPIAVAVLLHHARGASGAGARLRAAAAAALLLAVGLLVAVHAAYGFRAGFPAAGAVYASDAMRAALDLPVLGRVLALLPAPLVRGLDYQLRMGDTVPPNYFAGAYAAHHPLYHLVGFVVKSPEVQVAAAALVLFLGLPRWLGRGAERGRRAGVLLLLGTAAVPFLYLSLVARLQIGIRYVLPVLPIGCVLIGGLAELPAFARRPGRGRAAAAALVLLSALSLATAWPNGPGFFNAASGGPGRAWRLYTDQNADWGQMRELGLERLRARYPELEVLGWNPGPRLGPVAVYARFRAPEDPEDPPRARHWVDALPQIAHAGAAWFVYDATPAAWRAAADADPRARADLAVALLGAGRLDEAEAEIARLPAERRAEPAALAELLRAHAAAPPGEADARAPALAAAWLAARRPDLALPLARGLPGARMLAVQSLVLLERFEEAVAVLAAVPRAPGEAPEEVLLLAELYRRTGRMGDAIALLERHLPALAGDQRDLVAEKLAFFVDLEQRWSALGTSLAPPGER